MLVEENFKTFMYDIWILKFVYINFNGESSLNDY